MRAAGGGAGDVPVSEEVQKQKLNAKTQRRKDTEVGKVCTLDPDGGYLIFCPGCKQCHRFDARWTFNGNLEKPTFRASMLVRSGHYLGTVSGSCWCTYNEDHPNDPSPFTCNVCHSFVTDGMIQFLGDSTHELAGKTVPLPEFF